MTTTEPNLIIWPHYEAKRLGGIADLRSMFPDGKCNELNFVLFSTSGVHGSYSTIEEIEDSLLKYGPDPEFMSDDNNVDAIPDDYCGPDLTTLIIHPRLCVMRYGNVKVTLEDIPYLKQLRKSAWEVVQQIGASNG